MYVQTDKYGETPKAGQFDPSIYNWTLERYSELLEEMRIYRGHGFDHLYAAMCNLLLARSAETGDHSYFLLAILWTSELNDSYNAWIDLHFPGVSDEIFHVRDVIKEENRYSLAHIRRYVSAWNAVDRAIDAWKGESK